MFKILLSQFIKQNGRNPNNLEMILLRQKAANQSVDERKVVNMFDREPVNPNKPILGGKNIDETEEQIRQRLIKQNEQGIANLKNKLDDPEKKAMGGRIGYKVGSKVVEGLLKALQNKFGKKAITTADKLKTPQKTLDRDMFKKFKDRNPDPNREMTADELEDFEIEIGGDNLEAYSFDGTVGDAKRILKEQEDYMAYMYDQYKTGKLDPVAGDKSLARKKLLEKRLEDMEASGDKRLMTRDEIEELSTFDLQKGLDDLDNMRGTKDAEAAQIKLKYPGISDDLIKKILIDNNPQRKAEVLATLDEAFKMMEKGKGADEIVETFKNQNRTKQADGGIMRAPFVGGGMGRRGFLKLLGSLGAGAAAIKTGILGLGGKQATKEVAKEVATSSGGVPPYFFKLVKKIKNLGDDVTQTASTQERQKVTRYKDYELTEDAVTGRQEIQRQKVKLDDDAADYYGNPLTEETYMSYSPGERIFQETAEGRTKIIKTNPEYEEGTALIRSDREFAGEVVDESFKISDDVIEEAMSEAPSIKIKKASGGIARMLGE
jgi:hypothetical protein